MSSEQPVVEPAPTAKPRHVAGPFNLAVTQSRLVLKAEAARWAVERHRLLAENADLNLEIRPQDHEFFRRAQEQGVNLWMLAPRAHRPATPDQFTLIAAWYENLAEALALLDLVIAESGWQAEEMTEPLLELAAVSQSALWVAVGECGGFGDEDQQAVFNWLRNVADEQRIFIRVGLKGTTRPIHPNGLLSVDELRRPAGRFEERQAQARKRKKLLAKVRHKASVLTEDTGELREACAN